jgi:cell division protein FtsW (lipid II flippase)
VEAVLAVVILALFVVRSAPMGRSCFYTIGACAAASIYVVQVMLNVFGTMDLLPLTGVTFPFVSNGGSSMLAMWGLLAFIKAGDTRQNASVAIRLPRGMGAHRAELSELDGTPGQAEDDSIWQRGGEEAQP